jgi:hypothetical protein
MYHPHSLASKVLGGYAMRYRSRVTNGPLLAAQRVNPAYAGICGNPWRIVATYYPSASFLGWVKTETMWDVVTPDFYRRRSQGKIINNYLDKTTVVEVEALGTFDWDLIQYTDQNCPPVTRLYTGSRDHGTVRSTAVVPTTSYLAPPLLEDSDVRDIAVTNAFAKQKVNETMILATLGELGETITSLRSIFSRAIRIFMAVKRLNLKALGKELSPKELQNRYMEARYALRPLVYDVNQTLAAFNADRAGKRMTTRGFSSDSTASTRAGYVVRDDTYVKILTDQSVSRTITARAGVLSTIKKVSHLQNWGADQILSSAWELVPLSFVCDWFFNVGKTIAALSPTCGLQQLASWVVVEDTIIQSSWVSGAVPKWPTTRIHEKSFSCSGAISKTTIRKYRVPNPQVSVLPSFDVKLDGWKILDLAIIMKNIFK